MFGFLYLLLRVMPISFSSMFNHVNYTAKCVVEEFIYNLLQMNIVNKCRELGCGPGGFYRPGYNDGAKLRLYMMCLGLDWNPQTKSYGERRQHDNALPPHIPCEFTSLVCRALDDSHDLIERYLKVENVEDELPKMCPDVCIVNFYTTNGRLGLHQVCSRFCRILVLVLSPFA